MIQLGLFERALVPVATATAVDLTTCPDCRLRVRVAMRLSGVDVVMARHRALCGRFCVRGGAVVPDVCWGADDAIAPCAVCRGAA